MAGTQAGAIIAVEVLVEQDEIAPMWIFLENARTPVNRPASTSVAEEDAGQTPREILGDLVQIHELAGAGRTLHLEVLAVVHEVVEQRADDQPVDRHPDRAAP